MAHSKTNPPKVPEGWKAVFDDEYQTYFFVNLSNGKSQWEEPKGTSWNTESPPPYKESRPAGAPASGTKGAQQGQS